MNRFDSSMEAWAQWCHRGQLVPGYRSLTNVLIENKGVMCFGSGGRRTVVDTIECEIEAALMQLHTTDPDAVKVCRVEYGAVTLSHLSPAAKQADKAQRLGISLRTYKRRLSLARAHIIETLKKR